eukprot:g5486.t1
MRTEVPLEGNNLGEFFATGFVVDTQYGIIATNRHVSGTSPSYYQVGFFDGSSRDATLLWYDPMEDFAFLRITPDEKGDMPPLHAVNISKRDGPVQAGDNILLIGNNEGKDFSVKRGQIASLRRHSTSRRNLFIQTTLDRTGGASGSPIFDTNFEVVAIHSAGTDTTSMEIPIRLLASCLRNIVQQLAKNTDTALRIPRGEIGARYGLESVGNAVRFYGMSRDYATNEMTRQLDEMSNLRTGSPPCVPVVAALVPRLPAVGSLNPGDIILKVGTRTIGCDLSIVAAALDEALKDETASPTVDMEVMRLGERKRVTVPVVDANDHKVDRAVQIAGSVFQDLTPGIRILFVGNQDGVWLSYASPGSPFEEIGQSDEDSPGKTQVLVTAVNGHDVKNLDDLVEVFDDIMSGGGKEGRDIFVTLIDYKLDELTPRATTVSLETVRANIMWKFDPSSRVWSHRSLFVPSKHADVGEGSDVLAAAPTTSPPKPGTPGGDDLSSSASSTTVGSANDGTSNKETNGGGGGDSDNTNNAKDDSSVVEGSEHKTGDKGGKDEKGVGKESSPRDTGVRRSSSTVQISSLDSAHRFLAEASSSSSSSRLGKKRPEARSKSLRL